MKFFHLSDLHFGKMLHGYDLVEEQQAMIKSITEMAEKEQPDAIVVAGDIYDRSVPSATAMTLLEDLFLALDELSQRQKPIEVLIIAGNHDSAMRLSYGSAFLERHHIHIAVLPPQQEEEHICKIVLQDESGNVNFYLLPYTKPGMVRHLPGTDEIQTSNDAVSYLLQREKINWEERNVLVSHQFYAAAGKEPQQCDSESPRLFVGGLDIVDTNLIKDFDYVALGHIHSPQKMGDEHIRYCGTLFPYSVSEAAQEKSIGVVELGKKGEVSYRTLPVIPFRSVRKLRGNLSELIQSGEVCHDYVSITLTDEEILERPKEQLERYYDHILEIRVENTRTKKIMEEETVDIQESTPLEAFRTFFKDSTGREMNAAEEEKLEKILEEAGEEQK
ncbi:MAG: exonuclease SbcCD subunit D [Butyribacter sp.]|nr:exonuclease SbcCD subunit D [bacterium]MDY3853371.1 exonuclease SbcCD subunit D [Butyribacter sp.]